jgi:hypothetical protein
MFFLVIPDIARAEPIHNQLKESVLTQSSYMIDKRKKEYDHI